MSTSPDLDLGPFLASLDAMANAAEQLRVAADMLDEALAAAHERLESRIDIFDLLAQPGTASREAMIDALNAMHTALMTSRGEWYRVLIEQKGMSLAAIARATGHPRQLIKRRYESLKKRRPTGNQESDASIE